MRKQRQGLIKAAFAISMASMIIGGALLSGATFADNPKPGMRNILSATSAEFTLYQVRSGMEQQFLDAMVKAGPYDRQLAALANEKILAPPPGVEAAKHYFSIARYYDATSAQGVRQARKSSIDG